MRPPSPAPDRATAVSTAVVAAALGAALLVGCGGGSEPGRSGQSAGGAAEAEPTTTTGPETTTTTVASVRLAVTGTELLAGAGTVPLPTEVAAAAAGVAERWVRATTLVPLETGAVGADLDQITTDAVWARLQGPDRAALVDEGLGAGGPVQAARAEVSLAAVEGRDRPVAVVVARVSLDVQADGGAHVVRDGQLVLVPAGDGWLVDGYALSVTRQQGGDVDGASAEAAPASPAATAEVGS